MNKVIACSLLSVALTGSSALAGLSGTVNAFWGGTSPGGYNPNSPPDTKYYSSGWQTSNYATSDFAINTAASAKADIANGLFSVAGKLSGANDYPANSAFRPNLNNGVSTALEFTDTIKVTSSTLAVGTNVIVTFHYALAFNESMYHSVGAGKDYNYGNNYTSLRASVSSYASVNRSGGDSFVFFSNDNKVLASTDGSAGTSTGLFAAGDVVERQISAKIGDTISFDVRLDISAEGHFGQYGGNGTPIRDTDGWLNYQAALLFGADPDDVVLQSTYTQGEFPTLPAVTMPNAQSALISVPEPASILMLGIAAGGLLLRRSRR